MTQDARKTREIQRSWPFWLDPHTGCPQWCVDTDRHSDGDERGDRQHYGQHIEVGLTLHDPVKGYNDTWTDEHWALYLQQHDEAATPSVWLGIGESDSGSFMSLEEATELAGELLDLVATATIGKPPTLSQQRAMAGLMAMAKVDEGPGADDRWPGRVVLTIGVAMSTAIAVLLIILLLGGRA
jgi:hypothetical protein